MNEGKYYDLLLTSVIAGCGIFGLYHGNNGWFLVVSLISLISAMMYMAEVPKMMYLMKEGKGEKSRLICHGLQQLGVFSVSIQGVMIVALSIT